MIFKTAVVLAFALLPGAPAFCADGAAVKYPPVVSATLKNGMRVLVLENKMSPTIGFHVYFRVGGIDNPSGHTGLAHLFEHMVFKGTKTIGTKNYAAEKQLLDKVEAVARQLNGEAAKGDAADPKKLAEYKNKIKELEKQADQYMESGEYAKLYAGMGADGLNAFTSYDYTGYVVSLPANRLESWMIVESDRFQNPVLREFYRERDVVLEELRMGKSRPGTVLWQETAAAAFAAHPYHNPIIGWESDVARLTRTEAENYFKSYYGPNNAVVAIVGDVDAAKTIALMRKYFENIPVRPLPENVLTAEPEQKGERRVEVVFDAQPQLLMLFKQPGVRHADYPALMVIDSVISGGRTGRFYKNLVEGKKLAAGAGSGISSLGERYPNAFYIYGLPKTPHTLSELEQGIYEELDKLKTEGISQWELEKTLNQLSAELVKKMESNDGMSNSLAYSECILGGWRYQWDLLGALGKVTSDDVKRAAARYFTKENRTVGLLVAPPGGKN